MYTDNVGISSYEDFNKCLNNVHMNSTYKGVFLYTLTDVVDCDDLSLVGREWVHQGDDFWAIDLAFPAIRYILYYWKMFHYDNIFHMSKRQTDASGSQNYTLNIFKIIRNLPDIKETPDLQSLMNRKDLYQHIIKEDIKKEMLHSIVKIFDGSIINDVNQIKLNTKLVNVIRNNQDQIRNDIQLRIYNHLNDLSENNSVRVSTYEDMGPFSRFFTVRRDRQIFLACVDGVLAEDAYNLTMNEGIVPDGEQIHGIKNVKLWGLRSTDENENIWKNIRRGDFVLFVCGGRCFSKGRVQETVKGTQTAEKLWPKDKIPRRELLIIFENVLKFDLDLSSPTIPGFNATVNLYNFPIIKAREGLSKYLNIIQNLSVMDKQKNLEKIDLTMVRVETKRRRGQEKFREMVLENYYNKCAVCKIDDVKLLQAAHILDVGHLETAGDINNGICLCVLHHKMFDVGYLYFDKEYEAHITNKSPKNIQMMWKSVVLDKSSCKHLPSKEHLRAHRDVFVLPENTDGGNVSR